jgi:ferredoxin-nitrite reductase
MRKLARVCSTVLGHVHVYLQVGDIGLMGAPAKKNGKAVEGFKIMLGGKIGENPALATDFAVVRCVCAGRV